MEKTVLVEGKGYRRPLHRNKVKAEIECSVESESGRRIISRNLFEVTLEEADDEIWDEVEECLMSMREGEESTFIFASRWYRIKLHSFERTNEIWKLSVTEKLDIAHHHKQLGNELFKLGKTVPAASRYSRALKYIISIDPLNQDQLQGNSVKKLKVQCLLNMCACHLQLKHYCHTIETASKALKEDCSNSKALYRRGTAYLELKEYDSAEADLVKAIKYDPNNKVIEDQLKVVRVQRKSSDQSLQEAMKKMFSSANR